MNQIFKTEFFSPVKLELTKENDDYTLKISGSRIMLIGILISFFILAWIF